MALNALTLSVSSGVQGRPFKSAVSGFAADNIVEVISGGAPGWGYSNGFLTNEALPYDTNLVVLRERNPVTGENLTTRVVISAVTLLAVQQQAAGIAAGGRWRIAPVPQGDGSLLWTLFVEDPATGATTSAAVGGGVVAPTLGTLSFSTSFTVGTAISSGTITGATAGSTIAGIPGITVSGTGTTRSYSGTPTASGAQNFVETLAGATGSPKSTGVTVAAASPSLLAPVRDDFNVVSPGTSMNNRVVPNSGGITWAVTNPADSLTSGGAPSNISKNAMSVDVTGKGVVQGNAAFGTQHASLTLGSVYGKVRYKLPASSPPSAGFEVSAHITSSEGGTNVDRLAERVTRSTATPTMTNVVTVGGTVKYNGSGANSNLNYNPQTGDIFERETYSSGGVDYIRFWVNGYQYGQPDDSRWVSGAFKPGAASVGLTLTGKHGFVASSGTTQMIDTWSQSADGTHDWMRAIMPARIWPRETDGTSVWKIPILYTGTDPSAAGLKYRLYLASDNSVVAGHDGVPVAAAAVDSANKIVTVTLNPFTPASVTTQYWAKVWRTDAVDGTGAATEDLCAETGYIHSTALRGAVVTFGQSLNVAPGADSAQPMAVVPISTGTYSAPGNSYQLGPIDTDTAYVFNSWMHTPTANSVLAAAMSFLNAKYPGPMQWISTGAGGTAPTASIRNINSMMHATLIKALAWFGNKIDSIFVLDGQSSAGTGNSNLIGYANAYFGGGSFGVGQLIDVCNKAGYKPELMITPNGAVTRQTPALATDCQHEVIRRFQAFEIPANAATFYPGGTILPPIFYMDLQHLSADTFHLTPDSYVVLRRRQIMALLHSRFPVEYPNSFQGPKLVSAARSGANQIVVTGDLNGCENLVKSTGFTYATTDQFSGGLNFSAGTDTPSGLVNYAGQQIRTLDTNLLWPTAADIAVSGQTFTITFTFASLPASVPIYVRGPFGAEPFNVGGSTTNAVSQDMANKASIFQGTITGETPLHIQPFWQANRQDYLTAS